MKDPRYLEVVNSAVNSVGSSVATRWEGFQVISNHDCVFFRLPFFFQVISNNDCVMRIVDVERCFAEVCACLRAVLLGSAWLGACVHPCVYGGRRRRPRDYPNS